ncbi:SUN domain-containing protein 1-like [Aristolochia californica]|uniref:SUN domain-containing protein 1-like n=1 Tax=Aristolochia californica TaxID=171875 RepID=UPI0035D74ED5
MSTPNAAVADSHSLDSKWKTNTRRRTVIRDKMLNVETVSEGLSGAGDDKVVSGRDLSHSIRGETVIERPKDLPQLRENLSHSPTSLRRSKHTQKPEKPLRKTVLSVLVKNILLLLVLYGLGCMVFRILEKSESGHIVSVGVSDFESRMSEVETFLKTTAKMMQVQVDAVDRKFEGEIGNLRRELTKSHNEKIMMLESEFKKLGTKAGKLERSLTEIREKGLFSKEDFDKFLSELRKNKELDGTDKEFSLDEIRAYAREVIEKEIQKHAADGLGRVDYALASGGAKVVRHSEPFFHGRVGSWFSMGKPRNWIHEAAKKMLEPSFGEPGQCFALKGSSGFVEIRLRTAIILEAVTLEHVAKSVAYDRSSAPKECRVSAWFQEIVDDASAKRFLLAAFTYDIEKSNAQTFNAELASSTPVNMIRLDFASNHGSLSHTCIYRLRVHGYEPTSVMSLPTRTE